MTKVYVTLSRGPSPDLAEPLAVLDAPEVAEAVLKALGRVLRPRGALQPRLMSDLATSTKTAAARPQARTP